MQSDTLIKLKPVEAMRSPMGYERGQRLRVWSKLSQELSLQCCEETTYCESNRGLFGSYLVSREILGHQTSTLTAIDLEDEES